jgi:hypothetical protein
MNTYILKHNRKWNISDKMLWQKDAYSQNNFMRDIIGNLLGGVLVFNVSSHTSKSINLPVYGLVMRNGIAIIARDNFYDWKVSIKLPKPIKKGLIPEEIISDGLKENIPSCYCEGFHDDWVYEGYDPDKEQIQFTIEIRNKYDIYLLMFILKNALPELEFNDSRNEEEIVKSIEAIFKENGVYETVRYKNEDYDRQLMRGYELLYRTYYTWENEANKHYETDTFEDPNLIAKEIMKYPKVKHEFLLQEYMFNYKF